MKTRIPLVALALATAITTACASHRRLDDRIASLDKKIATDVPPGSPREKVESFLEAQGVNPVYSPEQNEVFGKIEGVRRTILQRTDLALFFELDSAGNLREHRVEAWVRNFGGS